MARTVVTEVPEENGPETVDVRDLEKGSVFKYPDGYGIRVYDGVIAFEPGADEGDEIIVYGDDELESSDDLEGAVLRNDLRLKIVLERV